VDRCGDFGHGEILFPVYFPPSQWLTRQTCRNPERKGALFSDNHRAGGQPMSMFGSIMSKIFNAAESAIGKGQPASAASPTGVPASTSGPSAPASSTQTPSGPVDVEAVLVAMASAKGGGGNWQSSIVDLLKLLDLDSSLNARKELAGELNVHVGADGSAEQNIGLHKAVMQKLAENGGKVPDSMKG
jgi:hypothetical protein